MASCARHPHERGVSPCRRCGAAWCGECLVYSFGDNKLPYCMSCAMYAGGIRTTPARPALSKREVRKLAKAAKATTGPTEGQAPPSPVAQPNPGLVEADTDTDTPVTDWEKPWWEDRESTMVDGRT